MNWRLKIENLAREWPWLALVSAGGALIGFVAGYAGGCYTATVELLLTVSSSEFRVSSSPQQPAGTRNPTPETAPASGGRSFEHVVAQLLGSETVLRRVAKASGSAFSPESLASATRVTVTPDGGLVALQLRGRDPQATVRLANVYGEEASAAVQDLWASQCREADRQITEKLVSVDQQLADTSRELLDFQSQTGGIEFEGDTAPSLRPMIDLNRKAEGLRDQIAASDLQIQNLNREISRLSPALIGARDALNYALARYTEAHPKVKELRGAVEAIEAQCAAQAESGIAVLTSPAAVNLYTRVTELKSQRASLVRELESLNLRRQEWQAQVKALPDHQAQHVRLKSQYEALKDQRFVLARRQQDVQWAARHGLNGLKVLCPADLDHLKKSEKVWTGLRFGGLAGALGLVATALVLVARPAGNRRIRTRADLEEATGLPFLAALGNLDVLTAEERQQWAFRTFTLLRGRFTESDRDALICGFTSATHGEGRSTWIQLLSEAAGRLGYRVLVLSAANPRLALDVAGQDGVSSFKWPVSSSAQQLAGTSKPHLDTENLKLETEHSPLETPLARGPHVRPVPLGAWAWNLEHREQWRTALRQWKTTEQLAVFVELPPASVPEAVLLAEGLPNLVWLSSKDMARSSETRRHLETLRHARARLAGCALNHGPSAARARRVAGAVLLGLLLGAVPGRGLAADTNAAVIAPEPIQAKVVGPPSIAAPDRLADWQKRLTLGPGDTFDISIYEQPDSVRPAQSIGPDGRINYLEARDVVATGLTVDELRARLETVLAKYHRSPRVIIVPTAYVSKKYYLLGNVNQKGVFLLDRPVSLVEALARARGFVAPPPAAYQRNPLIQADLARSFLIRRQADGTFHRVAVDFESLFLQGDLAQNIALEPDDYLFFPPVDLQEVYVLGQVNLRGVMPYSRELTALGAIAARAGFTERAWRQKVLVVRGSLNQPQTFIIDAAAVLSARSPDFPLKNRDIVYVHEKPWAKAQELLEVAVTSFANSFITGLTYQHVGPWIKDPWIK